MPVYQTDMILLSEEREFNQFIKNMNIIPSGKWGNSVPYNAIGLSKEFIEKANNYPRYRYSYRVDQTLIVHQGVESDFCKITKPNKNNNENQTTISENKLEPKDWVEGEGSETQTSPTRSGAIKKTKISRRKSKDVPPSVRVYGKKFKPYRIIPSTVPSDTNPRHRSRLYRKSATPRKKIPSILPGSILHITAEISDSYRMDKDSKRILFYDEVCSSKEEFLNLIAKKLHRKNPEDFTSKVLKRWNTIGGIFITGVAVENLNFGDLKDKAFLETKDVKLLPHNCFKVICLFDKIYITIEGREEIELVLKDKPITDSQFINKMNEKLLESISKNRVAKVKELVSLQEKVAVLQREYGELAFTEKSVRNSMHTMFGDTLTKIKELASVKELTLLHSGLKIITNDLWAESYDEGKRNSPTNHYMGSFEILLELEGDFTVRFRNLSSPSRDRTHPHGSCAGSHTAVMGNCLRKLDYYSFVLAVIEMLQTVNPSEQGSSYLIRHDWPLKKPAKAKLTEIKNYTKLIMSDYSIRDEEEMYREIDYHNEDNDERETSVEPTDDDILSEELLGDKIDEDEE